IQGDCLIYGMKISLLFANSMKKFFDFKIKKNVPDKKIEKIKTDLTKYIVFLENNPDASFRELCRKYTLKKVDAIAVLKSLQCANIQHKLIEDLE
ncbi:hypothetical protein AB8Q35_28660, partial [Klebsiella pneumoniae]